MRYVNPQAVFLHHPVCSLPMSTEHGFNAHRPPVPYMNVSEPAMIFYKLRGQPDLRIVQRICLTGLGRWVKLVLIKKSVCFWKIFWACQCTYHVRIMECFENARKEEVNCWKSFLFLGFCSLCVTHNFNVWFYQYLYMKVFQLFLHIVVAICSVTVK